MEHTQQAIAEIRRATESGDRKNSSENAALVSSKDPMRDVPFAVIATKWDLENERGHPSFALQSMFPVVAQVNALKSHATISNCHFLL